MTIQPKKLNCSKLAALATMCSFAAVLSAGASASAVPKTATLIPAPREIRATGGEYWERKPPKLEKVAGIPPEGYELSITTKRHHDPSLRRRGRVLCEHHALPFGALGREGEVQGLSVP